jgi:hypothetical protein
MYSVQNCEDKIQQNNNKSYIVDKGSRCGDTSTLNLFIPPSTPTPLPILFLVEVLKYICDVVKSCKSKIYN